jgi:hypothetical protein
VGVAVHPNAANLLNYNWVVMSEVLIKTSWLKRAGFEGLSCSSAVPL